MRGLCFSNKGIYKFETTPEKVKLKELNNNTIEELSISEYDYKLYSGEIIRVTKEIKEYIKDEKILRMLDMYAQEVNMVIHYGRYSHKLVNSITKGNSIPKDIKNYEKLEEWIKKGWNN